MIKNLSAPKISVVVNFYNMRREAERTLFSLTPQYQRGVHGDDYEVIAIDNGSTEPLEESRVKSFGGNFHYIYFKADSPSPCAAINHAINKARARFVMCCIDGARILSPGILKYALAASQLHEHSFIYTIGMHLGPEPQNYLVSDGYNQQVEDRLIRTVNWRGNGYELFKISSIALSSKNGFYSLINESNCFMMRKDDLIGIGGFDERFTSPGGGVVNLDVFNIVHEDKKFSPVLLLGEATFHQFHHGVATNVPMKDHPWNKMMQEYALIKGKPFKHSHRQPEYYGWLSLEYHAKLMSVKSFSC